MSGSPAALMSDRDILDADDIEKIAVTLDEAGFTVKAASLRAHDRALRVDRDGWRTLSGLVQDWYTAYRRRNPEGQVAVLTEERDAARAHVRRAAEMRLRVEHDLANAFGRAETADARVAVLTEERDSQAVAINLLHAAAAEASRERNAATERVAVLEAGLRDAKKLLDEWLAMWDGTPRRAKAPVDETRALLGGVPATKEEQTVPLSETSPQLIGALQHLFDEYGPTGVAETAAQMLAACDGSGQVGGVPAAAPAPEGER